MIKGIVLDASVAMTWFYPDENSKYAYSVLDTLTDVEARVPAIWPTEVANCILAGERRRRATRAESARFMALIESLSIDIDLQGAERALSLIVRSGPLRSLHLAHPGY